MTSRDGPAGALTAVRSDDGSAVAEFSLVSALLTLLTLAVIQLGLALHVRNTVLDAAAEGARLAALADTDPIEGVARTRELIAVAVGGAYAEEVGVSSGMWAGQPCTIVTVTTTLPLIGLLGVPGGLEVTGHAATETLD